MSFSRTLRPSQYVRGCIAEIGPDQHGARWRRGVPHLGGAYDRPMTEGEAPQSDADREEIISRLRLQITREVLSESPEISADDPTLEAAINAAAQYVKGQQNLVSLGRSVESARLELQTALAAL